MVMKKRIWYILFILAITCLVNLNTASAQVCDPNLDPFCEDPDDYPLDTNVYYLLAATALVVILKFKTSSKEAI